MNKSTPARWARSHENLSFTAMISSTVPLKLADVIFGPIQSILKFETLDEVIDRANDAPTTGWRPASSPTTSKRRCSSANTRKLAQSGSLYFISSFQLVDVHCRIWISDNGRPLKILGRRQGVVCCRRSPLAPPYLPTSGLYYGH
ncbi:hypothetical protein EVAR_17618_1 [Eumeta japonica]|uniref:Uncharacterized protein n=1 Tax=Eumeta variegata TaxID=151549 RepID=A0A4C1UC84_EUMVA|nr:hypothetical protein EVAR_17618_1 [Eumeta japonica]